MLTLEVLVMNRSILGFAATALLTITVQTGFAEEPAASPAIHQAAASANVIARADKPKQTGPAAHISNLSIFPTPDSNTVFVRYTTSSDVGSPAKSPDSEHLALLEMRGDRIAKIRNSSADAVTLSTLEASVVARLIGKVLLRMTAVG